MNVLIFGATGGIGQWAVKHAKKKGYHVTVYIRNAKKLKDTDVKIIEGTLNDKDKIKKALQGIDAVVWTVGVPMKRNYEGTASTDGHRVLIEAMKETGVKRLIDWGTPSIHFKEDTKSTLTVLPGILASILFKKAKQEAVDIGRIIEQSDLDWTIVRFMAPKDSPYQGKANVTFGDKKVKWSISREDIAEFMIEQIEDKRYIKSMPIIGG